MGTARCLVLPFVFRGASSLSLIWKWTSGVVCHAWEELMLQAKNTNLFIVTWKCYRDGAGDTEETVLDILGYSKLIMVSVDHQHWFTMFWDSRRNRCFNMIKTTKHRCSLQPAPSCVSLLAHHYVIFTSAVCKLWLMVRKYITEDMCCIDWWNIYM